MREREGGGAEGEGWSRRASQGFIHIGESHCRNAAADKAKGRGPRRTKVLSGPVHSVARHKWQPKVRLEGGGRGGKRSGEPREGSERSRAHEGAICRHCIAIDLAFHSFADIAEEVIRIALSLSLSLFFFVDRQRGLSLSSCDHSTRTDNHLCLFSSALPFCVFPRLVTHPLIRTG